ncbi:MAG: response regulator transcription factor [Nitrospira sp.]|nr:response regulator transcription factor [Nitrospira sp.]
MFLTANDDKRLLRSAILAGAQGYMLKMASSDAVVKAIEIVAAGQAIMDPQLTQEIFEWIRDKARPVQRKKVDNGLEFDKRVLALIAGGKTNQEIASRLNVTPQVLLTRLRVIYRRLNISRKADAGRYFSQ